MRIFNTIVSLFLLSSINAQISFGENMNGIMQLEYKAEYESKSFSDSIERQFLVVSVMQAQPQKELEETPDLRVFIDDYYCNMSSFYVNKDQCRLYPIHYEYVVKVIDSTTYNVIKGYYLIDDFKSSEKSIQVAIEVQSGFSMQSQMNTLEHYSFVIINKDNSELSHLAKADSKWYRKWRKLNLQEYNPRAYQEGYSGCN